MTESIEAESAIIESDSRAAPLAVIPPKPSKRAKENEKDFIDSVTVKRLTGDDVPVPLSLEGARNANLITAELCRDLVEKTIDSYLDKDKVPTPKELADLASAAKTVGEMALRARGSLEEGSKGAGGALTDLMKAAGKGASNMDQFQRLTIMLEKAAHKPMKNITLDVPVN